MPHLRLLFGILLLATSAAGAQDGWQPLFNGKDFAGWETFLSKPEAAWNIPGLKRDAKGDYTEPVGTNRDPLKVFSVEEQDGQPAIHISGQGFGTLTTTNSFANFHLRLQFKWGERRWGRRSNSVRDSGLLYFCHGELGAMDGAWPRSVEFQIQEHDCGDLYAVGTEISVRAIHETNRWIYSPNGTETIFLQRKPVGNRCIKLADAEKPRGDWNTLELVCLNGDSIHVVNGKIVMRLTDAQRLDGSAPAPLDSGRISLQTEGAEIYYRNVELRSINEMPAEFKP